ncbi:hypothetical protein MNQ98_16990 [Paenibacillus sp. N3/727]|uniref:hypothetical protein n=1 Tax=Paenibacillus sp. N3/727 TaxID=2925845 RepID=UPI001F52C6EA|nr:hypothetical protein [Paenibacillus sp. N3/727]UNK16217.1 hypothetical protein MNQ98_16990 [Paenibacillus sp. N3/727]
MDKKLMRLLKKLYQHSNGTYDPEREVILYKELTLTKQELDLLQEHNWHVNEVEYIAHDELFQIHILITSFNEKGEKECKVHFAL